MLFSDQFKNNNNSIIIEPLLDIEYLKLLTKDKFGV